MIYQEINFSAFCDAFTRMGRKESFSHEGLKTLYRWLDDLSETYEKGIELDVIAICCDWCEMNEEELNKEYNHMSEFENFDDLKSWLNDRTTVLETENDSYLIMAF